MKERRECPEGSNVPSGLFISTWILTLFSRDYWCPKNLLYRLICKLRQSFSTGVLTVSLDCGEGMTWATRHVAFNPSSLLWASRSSPDEPVLCKYIIISLCAMMQKWLRGTELKDVVGAERTDLETGCHPHAFISPRAVQ